MQSLLGSKATSVKGHTGDGVQEGFIGTFHSSRNFSSFFYLQVCFSGESTVEMDRRKFVIRTSLEKDYPDCQRGQVKFLTNVMVYSVISAMDAGR